MVYYFFCLRGGFVITPASDQVRAFVALAVASSFSSCSFEFLSAPAAGRISRRVNRALSESEAFSVIVDLAAGEILQELKAAGGADV